MTTVLHVEEVPERVSGNAAPNINHQLLQSLVQMCDCSKEEGLQLDVVIGTCVTSGGTVWMWAWKIRCKYCSVDHQRRACLCAAQGRLCMVVSTNPNLAETRRGMFVERFCPWHFLFAFS